MPKVAYSEEDRQRVRQQLVRTALELMAKQGIRHTTVEQVYKSAGISRTFFYTFFPTKEDLIVEAIYLQQPRVLEYARSLLDNPELDFDREVYRSESETGDRNRALAYLSGRPCAFSNVLEAKKYILSLIKEVELDGERNRT